MKIELLTKWLEDGGLGTRGVDIYAHRMDADCKKGIVLRLPLEGVKHDWNLPGYHKADIQAIVRAAKQTEGDALSEQVTARMTMYNKDFFDESDNLVMIVKQMLPRNLPIVYPRSDGQGIEWSIDFATAWVMR